MAVNGDLRSLNDNSKEYRENRLLKTEVLLKKALSSIYDSNKNFSHINVCTTMELLANDEDKLLRATISPSAISKNKKFRQIIETYKLQNNILKEKQKKYHLSEGDIALELHKSKTLLVQKIDEVKILKDIIEKENIQYQGNSIEIQEADYDYKFLLKKAYELMIKEQIAFMSADSLILEIDHSAVADKKLLTELELL